jgi:hypothetical protein
MNPLPRATRLTIASHGIQPRVLPAIEALRLPGTSSVRPRPIMVSLPRFNMNQRRTILRNAQIVR